jgi:hypothetical protein
MQRTKNGTKGKELEGMEGAGMKEGCLNQLLTKKWVIDKAFESGVTIMTNENYYYLLSCALTNAHEKELDNLHDLKESYPERA